MSHAVPLCPACGSANSVPVAGDGELARERFRALSAALYRGVMDHWLTSLTLSVLRCRTCGHHWYGEQPGADQLAAMYDATADRHAGKNIPDAPSARMVDQMRRLLRMVNRPSTGRPRLLDYGSGFGRWARAADQIGFDVTAYEPSASRGQGGGGEATSRITLVHDLDQLAGQSFDAINLEQVLEHIAEPLEALTKLRALCRSGTVIRITVPNLNRTPEGAALWETWPYDGVRQHTMAPFEHLQGFVPHSLRTLARRAGYVEIPLGRILRADPVRGARQALRGVLPVLDTTAVFLNPAT